MVIETDLYIVNLYGIISIYGDKNQKFVLSLGFWLLFDQIPKDWNWHSICMYRIVHDNIIVHEF